MAKPLELCKGWRLCSGSHSFVLSQRKRVESGKHKGKYYWDDVGWYVTIDSALRGFYNQYILGSKKELSEAALDALGAVNLAKRSLAKKETEL